MATLKNSEINTVKDFCQMKCDTIVNSYRNSKDNKLILSNFGELTEDQVDSILLFIENELEKYGEPKGLIKRIFSVVVEGLQNIRIHGTENEIGKETSFIIIGKDKNNYNISVANMADNSVVEKIKASLQRIKGLNIKTLKKMYLGSLAKGRLSDKGGAGLGILTIALKSENNVKFDFEKVNSDLTFFNLNITISAN